LINCEICTREFSSTYPIEHPITHKETEVCHRCGNAINNFIKLYQYLELIIDKVVRESYKYMILDLFKREARLPSGEVSVGLIEAPAGRRNHHAYSGGLLSHIIQMIEICFTIYHYKSYPYHGVIDKGDIVIGCLIHDLHKAIGTFVRDFEKKTPPFRYSSSVNKKMMPDDINSISILSDYKISPKIEHINAIIGAEGHYSMNFKEVERGKLAALISMADTYSSIILKK